MKWINLKVSDEFYFWVYHWNHRPKVASRWLNLALNSCCMNTLTCSNTMVLKNIWIVMDYQLIKNTVDDGLVINFLLPGKWGWVIFKQRTRIFDALPILLFHKDGILSNTHFNIALTHTSKLPNLTNKSTSAPNLRINPVTIFFNFGQVQWFRIIRHKWLLLIEIHTTQSKFETKEYIWKSRVGIKLKVLEHLRWIQAISKNLWDFFLKEILNQGPIFSSCFHSFSEKPFVKNLA